MTTSFDPLKIRRRLGLETWGQPRPYGPDGWVFLNKAETGDVIITCAERDLDDRPGGLSQVVEFVHASMAFADRDPTYLEIAAMHQAVWPGGYAYMVFAPSPVHVNIHEHALHLWGRLDGRPMLPEMSFATPFGRTI